MFKIKNYFYLIAILGLGFCSQAMAMSKEEKNTSDTSHETNRLNRTNDHVCIVSSDMIILAAIIAAENQAKNDHLGISGVAPRKYYDDADLAYLRLQETKISPDSSYSSRFRRRRRTAYSRTTTRSHKDSKRRTHTGRNRR